MNILKTTVLVISFLTATVAIAGNESSGGGPSIVCMRSDHTVGAAQLYDLFEGRARFGLNIPESEVPRDQQIANALKKLSELDYGIAYDAREIHSRILKQLNFAPEGVLLQGEVTDLGKGFRPLVPAGCALEYAAYYESIGNLVVSKSIYAKFSETQKAALIIHEALYKLARQTRNLVDSEATRILTSYLFSTETVPSDIVSNSLRMHVYSATANSPIIKTDGTEKPLLLTARCTGRQDANDRFYFSGSFRSRKHLSTTESVQFVGLLINEKQPMSATLALLIDPEMAYGYITSNEFGDISKKRSGRCGKLDPEVYYGGAKQFSIPFDSNSFSFRFYPESTF